jgi:aspartyl-tRNA(Asn)/glutamyl-tRNA(Gln) amidotransferase subunit A
MIDFPALRAANTSLNAFVDFDEGAAIAQHGPLAGLTVGVKSNIMVRGLPWTGGMGLYRDRIAKRDARVVDLLRSNGAAILGSLNMHEAALGATTDNAFFGRTHNPHRIGHTPGGSSGGSAAAVAAGLCDIALGTDTLGSVRIPAAYCGVYGLKPTSGAVSTDGLAFLDPSFDSIGPLAASLDLIEAAWRAIVDDPGAAGNFRTMLLLDNLGGVEVEPAVRAAYDRALHAVPLTGVGFSLPHSTTDIRWAGLASAGRWLIKDLGEEYHPDNPGLSKELKYLLGICAKTPERPDILTRTRIALTAALGTAGVLLLPTTPQAAFSHDGHAPANQADFTGLANIAGLPAIAIPAGFNDGGLPVSVQLVGPAHSELRLIALARTVDAALQAYRPPATFGF